MTASRILVLAIAAPLFVYGIIRFTQLVVARIAEQGQGRDGQPQSAGRGIPQGAVPLGIVMMLVYLFLPSFVGWEALLVIAILAAYYAIGTTWWQFAVHSRSGDWRQALLLSYFTGWIFGSFVAASVRGNGPRFGFVVLMLLIIGDIVLARRRVQRLGKSFPKGSGSNGD